MKINTQKIRAFAGIAGMAIVCVILLEIFTLSPRYSRETATIISVQEDDESFREKRPKITLVEFADGFREFNPGDLGEPGDTFKARRRDGVSTLFGVFGHSIFDAGE
jgi:hypothetical protein